MKKFIYIVLLSLISGWAVAQPQLIIPTEDPFRAYDNTKESSSNARTASFTTNVDDTLKLPFFEDFASPYVATDSVHNLSTAPIKLYSSGLHGLQSKDSIYVYEARPDLYPAVINKFYVKVIDPFNFELFTDKALGITDSFPGNDTDLKALKWSRTPYDSSIITLLIFPDTLKWENNSNVYINDRYAVQPPSYNVATFDGLNQAGVPYSNSSLFVAGYNDKLTSLPIKMGAYSAADNLYISFFWQKSGYGEVANNGDFLALEFKDNTNTWNEVLRINGNTVSQSDTFYQEILQITDIKYMFDGFQFRFRNYGSQNGPFDIWNLDYIYIDSNRTATDLQYYDWAISETDASILKNYSSMPYNQFFANKANEINPSMNFVISNLNLTANLYTPGLYLCDESSNVLFGPEDALYTGTVAPRETFNVPVDYTAVTDISAPRLLHTTYYVDMYDTLGYPSFNNSYQQYTVLWDYYAFDDGSAEYGFATKVQGSKVANRIVVNTKDTLTHVDICFTKQKGSNMNGRVLLLDVRDDDFKLLNASKEGKQQQIAISYSTRANGFVRYQLDDEIILNPGTYHVGYSQNFTDLVVTGFDANTDHSDMLYVNNGNAWQRFDEVTGYIPGSLMIRPVFSKGEWLDVPNVTPIADQLEENYDVVLYPNPSSGEMNLQGDIKQVIIYDLYGKIVFDQTVTSNDDQLYSFDISSFSSGIYLVHVFGKKGSIVKKLIAD